MKLPRGHELGYCTNIHRGETWPEVFSALRAHSLAVRDRVAAGRSFGLGLRLGAAAVRDLQEAATRLEFQRWLERENCHVFTINGFPYGQFHGTRVKEQVYRPDWTTRARVDYTRALFDLLAELVAPGGEGSVSTLPLSFKAFGVSSDAMETMRRHLRECAQHIEKLTQATGRDLHLGLEPEPLCTLETSAELIEFLAGFDEDFRRVVGMNYDACHLAIEFEEPGETLARLRAAGVRISKFHLSSALRLTPTPAALTRLGDFVEETYLHQVVSRNPAGVLERFVDLPDALAAAASRPPGAGHEWRVHFHIPVHAHPDLAFGDTNDHIKGVLEALAATPDLCRHLEIETYTWAVLPAALREANVVDQIASEYRWVLDEMAARGLA